MSFPRYSKYKASGVEWLGEVPEHWNAIPIKILGRLKGGAGFPQEKQGVAGEELFFYKVNALAKAGSDGLLLQCEDTISRKTALQLGAFIFPPLTIVFAKVGAALLLGRIRLISQSACIDNNMMGLMVKQDQNCIEFVQYAMSLVRFELLANPGAVPSLNESQIGNFRLSIPPRIEQLQIANFLDRETAKIDALVAEQRRLIELLKEKRQAVISHAVTKGLNPHAPMKPSGVEWLGDVPEGWDLKRLKHISPFMTVGVVVNPSTLVVENGFPFIYGADIREGVIEWINARRIHAKSSSENAKTQLKAGDLLTVRVGAPGVTAVVPPECEGGNCASVMLIRQGDFNSHWLCYAMNSRVVRFQVEVVQYGAAQEQFNISHAVNFWVPTPSRAEQDKIFTFLYTETSKLDTLTTEAQRAIDLLLERRTALISAAVTGQIDVRKINTKETA